MKHKHCEVIKAWADGAKVQFRASPLGIDWRDVAGDPVWHAGNEYRVKPEPRPDVVFILAAEMINGQAYVYKHCEVQRNKDIKLTFDGETGKLKHAEVIS